MSVEIPNIRFGFKEIYCATTELAYPSEELCLLGDLGRITAYATSILSILGMVSSHFFGFAFITSGFFIASSVFFQPNGVYSSEALTKLVNLVRRIQLVVSATHIMLGICALNGTLALPTVGYSCLLSAFIFPSAYSYFNRKVIFDSMNFLKKCDLLQA